VKVVHVYKHYPPVYGGVENHIRTLAVEQARAGLDVQVLVTGHGRRTTRKIDRAVTVVKAGRELEVAQTPLSWRLCRELAAYRPDIIHLHVPYPMGELAELLFGRRRGMVVTYHSDVVRQRRLVHLYKPILWQVLQRANGIIVSSPAYALTSPFLAPLLEKCVVIPHGIDPAPFYSADPWRVAAVRRAWPGPLVLFVGKFRYYKGLSYLVEAAQWIRGRVLLVGTGPTEAAVRRQVETLGLNGRLGLTGEVDDEWLPAYYAAADVFVLPSVERSEAFGLVQLEAMASRLPIVCTELGTGTSFVNVHGETGFVVPPRDARALADAINSLLENPALRARFGAAGRTRVAATFEARRMAAQVAAVYRSAIE
jgi:glycosyltransferase involved in cell wall biosynthesis